MKLSTISLKKIKEIKHLPVVIFILGFIFDYITLQRIDSVLDNVFILIYLVLLGCAIILVNLINNGRIKTLFFQKNVHHISHVIQFIFGALLSNYVVFYLQSASMTSGSIFFFVLLILLLGNEFLGHKFLSASSAALHLCFYFFVTFSYLIFAIPIVTKHMNYYTFLAAGIMSSIITWAMTHFFYKKAVITDKKQYSRIIAIVLSILVTVNLFYLMNWIPPVPLSMKYSGIYHNVRIVNGNFFLTYVKPNWLHFWKRSDNPYLYKTGDKVYCFSSIFAPTSLKKRIYHHWLFLDPVSRDYISKERLGFSINGGREGGFRGFTYKQSVTPGKWRVEVRTEEGLLLGSISFKIEPDTNETREIKTIERL